MQRSLEVAFCTRDRRRQYIVYITRESSAPVSFPHKNTCDRLFLSNFGNNNPCSQSVTLEEINPLCKTKENPSNFRKIVSHQFKFEFSATTAACMIYYSLCALLIT